MQARLLSMVLSVGLIIGQLFLVQHALDLDSHANGELCEICMLFAGLDQALVHAHQPIGIQSIYQLTEGSLSSLHFQSHAIGFLARAPPQDLLYS
jgi:hypothetical protein